MAAGSDAGAANRALKLDQMRALLRALDEPAATAAHCPRGRQQRAKLDRAMLAAVCGPPLTTGCSPRRTSARSRRIQIEIRSVSPDK